MSDRKPLPLHDGTVDLARRVVRRAGRTERLTPREADLLALLAARPGAVVDRDELVRHLGGGPRAAYHVARRLRSKIEVDPARPRHLLAVGGGLRLETADTEAAVPPGEVGLLAAAVPDPPWERDPAAAERAGRALEAAVVALGQGVPVQADDEGAVLAVPDVLEAVALARRLARSVPVGVAVTIGDPVPGALLGYRGPAVRRARKIAATVPAGTVVVAGEVARRLPEPASALGVRRIPGLRDPEPLFVVGTPARPGLPTPATSFVGRRAEARAIEACWTDGTRVVSLCGPGGIGKTRLALESARRWPSGVAWAELRSARTLADVGAAVTSALRVPPSTPVADALSARGPVLLVLDDVDGVVDALAPALATWLGLAGELRVLATGRAALRISGEHVVRLGPLPPDEGRDLFLKRARSARAEAAITLEEADDVVARLEGWPLAIELCASRLGECSVPELLEELTDRFATLHARARDAAPHHASLEAAVGSSFDALDERLRTALGRIAVFRGGFDVEAAAAVVGPSAVGLLRELVERSLVVLGDAHGRARYSLMDTIRAYAERTLDPGDAALAHAEHYLSVARTRSPERDPDEVAWFGRESANLLAIHRRLRTSDPRRANAALLALEPWWSHLGPAGFPLDEIHDAVSSAERIGDPSGLAAALRARAFCLRESGRLDEADADVTRALALARDAGDRPLVMRVLAVFSHLRFDQDRLEDADALAALAQEVAESVGNPVFAGLLAGNRGILGARRGRLDEAEQHLRDAVRRLHALEATRIEAMMLGNLGVLLALQARDAEAEAVLSASLETHRQFGNATHEGLVAVSLGQLLLLRGEVAGAGALFDEALDRASTAGSLRDVVAARIGRALIDLDAGRGAEAAARLVPVRHAPLAEALHALASGIDLPPAPARPDDHAQATAVVRARIGGAPEPEPTGPQPPLVRLVRRLP